MGRMGHCTGKFGAINYKSWFVQSSHGHYYSIVIPHSCKQFHARNPARNHAEDGSLSPRRVLWLINLIAADGWMDVSA
jgi:hypothetical protein